MIGDPIELAAELVETALRGIDQRVTDKGLEASLIDWIGTLRVRADRLGEGYRAQVQASEDQLVFKCLRLAISEIEGSAEPFLPNAKSGYVKSLLALIMDRDDKSEQMIALGDQLILAAMRKGLRGTGHGQILEAALPATERLLTVAEEWRNFRGRR